MDNTIIQQGYFTADGNNKTLIIRSDIDWMRVYNLTEAAATNNGRGFEYYWQRGMPSATMSGLIYYHPAADHTVAIDTMLPGFGFELIDSSTYGPGAAVATTASSNVVRPVVLTANTAGLTTGTIVRKVDTVTPQSNLNGLDFSIDTVVLNTSFRLANALKTAPGIAGGAGTYRIIAPDVDTYKLFAPSSRIIADITTAASAVVTTLVDHTYQIGDKVRFNIPTIAGMTELNGQLGTITAVTASTFTVDIDTTAYTAFTFPVAADVPCLYPQVLPVGESTNIINPLINQGYIGMRLFAATAAPGGSTNDLVFWVAGKSFSV